jgi:hypothetical protein
MLILIDLNQMREINMVENTGAILGYNFDPSKSILAANGADWMNSSKTTKDHEPDSYTLTRDMAIRMWDHRHHLHISETGFGHK